jgi:hypothetical protein
MEWATRENIVQGYMLWTYALGAGCDGNRGHAIKYIVVVPW